MADDGEGAAAERARDARATFEANLPLIRGLLRGLCARHRLTPADGEDFSSYALLRMIEDDYAILRSFAGKSTLRTYLVTVTCRLLLDYRNQQWGKWHASARAKCLGGMAVRLETLIHRDGCSPAEAIEKLLAGPAGAASRAELESLASSLPRRLRRRFEGEERLLEIPAPERADDRLLEAERTAAARRLQAALDAALRTLPSEDRRILEMRYRDGIKVQQIAVALPMEARLLYRRIERCLKRLRVSLAAQGVSHEAFFERER